MKIINSTLMSSDSSGEEEGEEVIIVHPIPWLSADVVALKKKLDQEIAKEKSTGPSPNEAPCSWIVIK